ncbi:MAG: SAM-dependent methyltransferase [Muribaculaceae bacterium]|nr:SAM-dependent methyltransferase [Muribaculaceae bacterium]
MKPEAALYMIPVSISDAPPRDFIPAGNVELTAGIRHFIVENVRTARRFLRKCDPAFPIDECTFSELNNHTDLREVSAFLDPLRQGEPVGMMSEAGCPGVADPGALVAAIAQREGLRVAPLAGPSSILMSLMASGFNGQGFSFHGYLPVADADRQRRIRELEATARKTGMTQIFIETPYRNNRMTDMLASTLRPDTLLCVAAGIADPERESILTLRAADWKNRKYDYAKIPAIYLISVK